MLTSPEKQIKYILNNSHPLYNLYPEKFILNVIHFIIISHYKDDKVIDMIEQLNMSAERCLSKKNSEDFINFSKMLMSSMKELKVFAIVKRPQLSKVILKTNKVCSGLYRFSSRNLRNNFASSPIILVISYGSNQRSHDKAKISC